MKDLRRRDHGMTLLELILAVAILALIIGMTTVILLSVQSTWAEIQERTAAARAGWRFALDLSEQLRMALEDPARGWAVEGTDASRPLLDVLTHTDQLPEDIRKMHEAEQCDNDTITFAASRLGFGRRVYPGWLHYRIEYDEKTGECLGLFRRTTPLNRDTCPWTCPIRTRKATGSASGARPMISRRPSGSPPERSRGGSRSSVFI